MTPRSLTLRTHPAVPDVVAPAHGRDAIATSVCAGGIRNRLQHLVFCRPFIASGGRKVPHRAEVQQAVCHQPLCPLEHGVNEVDHVPLKCQLGFEPCRVWWRLEHFGHVSQPADRKRLSQPGCPRFDDEANGTHGLPAICKQMLMENV